MKSPLLNIATGKEYLYYSCTSAEGGGSKRKHGGSAPFDFECCLVRHGLLVSGDESKVQRRMGLRWWKTFIDGLGVGWE